MKNKEHGHYVEPGALEKLAKTIRRKDKERALEIMDIQPNNKILDIGCGPATDTIEFAKRLNLAGEIVGIDYDPEMIELADQKAKTHQVSDILKNIVVDLVVPNTIPYPDNYFDISHADRVLFHNRNPEYILQEMIRVTKVGGKIIVKGEDVSSWSWSPFSLEEDYFVKCKMAKTMHSWNFTKESLFLFKKNNLCNISIDFVPVVNTKFYGIATMMTHFARFGIAKRKAQKLIKLAVEYDKQDAYYDCMNVVITSGIKA